MSDAALSKAIEEMQKGLTGDFLGAHVYKKRIALPGRGKRGGSRAIVIFQQDQLVVYSPPMKMPGEGY